MIVTRNTFYETWYLCHSWVHYDRHCHLVFMSQLLAYLQQTRLLFTLAMVVQMRILVSLIPTVAHTMDDTCIKRTVKMRLENSYLHRVWKNSAALRRKRLRVPSEFAHNFVINSDNGLNELGEETRLNALLPLAWQRHRNTVSCQPTSISPRRSTQTLQET